MTADDAGSSRSAGRIDIVIASSVVGYAVIVLVGTRSYDTDARLYPTVAGGLAAVAGSFYLVAALRALTRRAPAQPDDAGMSGDGSPDMPERSAPVQFAGVLLAIGVLYAFGVYPFVISIGLLFGRFLSRLSWRTSLYLAAGLVLFAFLMLDLILGTDPMNTGLIAGWLD